MSLRKRAVFGLSLAVAATGFYAHPASANPAGTGLVISEVYGAGGNSGAVYNADFVEIFNPTTGSLDLTGMSVQYRSATGTGTGSFALSGSVAAGDTYLVQMSAPGANGAALTPDATADPAFTMSGSDGQVLLKASTDAFSGSGNLAGNAALVDMVGYGDGATSFEGAPTGIDLTATTSAKRFETGVDTDNNAADFTETVPSPGTIPDDPDPRTIAEIQGTGDASPLIGDFVITQGVVTARYPNGGYDGFYIQTGGSPDTPGASDALFVYAPALPNTAWPAIGASVEVAGDVSEFNGTTEITLVGGVGPASPAAVTPLSVPWTELDTDAEKESHEGELVAPQGAFTVTDSFDIDNFAEIGLAAGDKPLISPTDVADAQGTGDEAVAADNAARRITLDDGASINFREAANSDTPYPWLTPTNPVRVGAAVTFIGPVVLEFRNNLWKFQPRRQITGAGASTATFQNTRTAAPEEVGGDIRLATFNVLNYFPTTGVEFDDLAPANTCTFFRDRDGQLTTVNSCNPSGPRGAANEANLTRQQAKIVRAINALDASVVSLEELENSVKFGKNRDFAISTLVAALNADAGAGTWAFAPSPAPADMPTPAEEDVIRTGFIYKPADVELVGASQILRDEVNFDNAREPLAQVFKPAGGSAASAFAVIVNHFKSKGSGTPDPDGQGNANNDRIGQANALSAFADSFAADRGVEAVFLAGDFNAYTFEDPMQVLYADGYDNLESTTDPGEASYSFDGMSGSLDHVVANAAAERMVTGVDIWNINAEEAVAYEYSRYNANETMLFDGTQPFKASDHNPEVVGLNLSGVGTEEIQVLGTNDYHGRLAAAPKLAGAVKQLRAENPQTVFAAAGDLIGATEFASFIQHDKPTIDVMNEAGLEVSAVGNHEFDQGFDDLLNRVMAPESEENPEGGAEWKYLGANVKYRSDGSDALDATWIRDFGDVEVGFIGAVTEDLPSLVNAEGIADITVTDIVDETNAAATELKDEGADVVVLLVHEGASSTELASAVNPASPFGHIVNNVSPDVDAIVSGHTHLAYNHSIPVPEWEADPERTVKERPVVSAGQYGTNLNKLNFTVDAATGQVMAKTQSIVALPGSFPADAATQAIVDKANAQAAPLGAAELGEIEDPFFKAKFSNGTTDNRGGESTLGNLVAEVQRWATSSAEAGEAQIAFMNPGGLRADMVGTLTGEDLKLTYKQAADVQPFANTLINMDMTGENIRMVLEQQWQNNADGSVPSRPFLKLGVSEGFEYTYDPSLPEDLRITGMWLNGEAIDPEGVYSVTANSFLASGTGDNFFAFANATSKRDTGKVDLQAMVDYMDEFANTAEGDSPLPVDYAQRAVGVAFPDTAPEAYAPGDTVEFELSSLSMSAPTDKRDQEVTVSLGDEVLGTFPVTTTLEAPADANSNDEVGRASVSVVLPDDVAAGEVALTATGATTGTTATVTVPVASGELPTSTVSATAGPFVYGRAGSVDVTVDPTEATGDVQVFEGEKLLGEQTLTDGAATVAVPARTLKPGSHTLRVVYVGDERFQGSETELTVVVGKAKPVMTVKTSPRRIERRETRPVFDVALGEVGFPVAGKVTVSRGGESWTRRLADGKATFTLPTLRWAGEKTYTVTYLGNADAQSVTKRVTITVVG
jgi:5'-nucleotidase